MQYMGSKNRLAKHIVPVIQSYITPDTTYYWEPFVGGANVIDKIDHHTRIGSDTHKYLIALLEHVKYFPELVPDTISEDTYNEVKRNPDSYDPWFVGLVGFCATFGSIWFGTYARRSSGEDVPAEAIRNLLRQAPKLQGIIFSHGAYDVWKTSPTNAVIYCDIPYRNTTAYKGTRFDHDKFYRWALSRAQSNTVLISEYSMPEPFECVWEHQHTTSFSSTRSGASPRTERLYLAPKGH